MRDPFIQVPSSKEEWLNIPVGFEKCWNFPYCIGSIDGKHIRVECSKMTGTYYFNYKGFYSIFLLAICGSSYCFTLFDLEQYGSKNNCGVLANSKMKEMTEEKRLYIPPPSTHKLWFWPSILFFFGDQKKMCFSLLMLTQLLITYWQWILLPSWVSRLIWWDLKFKTRGVEGLGYW